MGAAGARGQPAGGDGATEMTFRSGGSISRQPCRGRLSEEAIRSVRCLRCHYTCDACLYTRLIINGVRVAAEGGTARLTRHQSPCAVTAARSESPTAARPFPQQPPLPVAQQRGSPRSRESRIPRRSCATSQGQTHIHNNASLFSPADFVPFFFPLLLLSSWLCHMQKGVNKEH